MDWIRYLFQGFIFGIAYVAPIGPQNLFVINTAISSTDIKYVLRTVLVVVFFDISLALACFTGVGIIFSILPVFRMIMLFTGFLVLLFMGIRLILSKKDIEYNNQKERLAFPKIIGLSFSVAWLNPQAIIDGTMLFGGMRASLPANCVTVFIIGVCFASVCWFTGLAIISYKIMDKFKKAIKYINKICGIILMLYGLKLAYELIKHIGFAFFPNLCI